MSHGRVRRVVGVDLGSCESNARLREAGAGTAISFGARKRRVAAGGWTNAQSGAESGFVVMNFVAAD